MARKTRRQKQRSAARPPAAARAPGARPDQSIGSTSSFSLTGGSGLAPADTDDDEAVAEEAESIEELTDSGADGTDETGAGVGGSDDVAASSPSPAARVIATGSPPAAAPGAAPRRRIERLSQATPSAARAGGRARGPSNAAAMFQPLDSDDAAIPFDRVPYVPADLRRVAVMAILMVVLIIIAAIIVTHVVQ